MKNLSMPRFLDQDYSSLKACKVSIIPAPFSKTMSWIKGAENGPAAILDASQALESFDDELLAETWRVGIDVRPFLDFDNSSSDDACQLICAAVDKELKERRFPVVLGGEHTVSLPAVAACVRHYPDLHVVQVDAHLDMRDTYNGSYLSHACVMRRIDDLGIPIVQVGIRSFSGEEWSFIDNKIENIFTMQRIRNNKDWLDQIVSQVSGPVYLSLDLDGFDPAIMPATGTPEPDGLTWNQVTSLFRTLAKRKKIVGLDIVELAPCPGAHHAEFTAAKILYRTLGYIFGNYSDLSVSQKAARRTCVML